MKPLLQLRIRFAAAGGGRAPGGRVGAVAGDDGPVGGGEVEGGEFAGRDPAEREVLEGGGRGAAGREAADEGKHFYNDARVIVEERFEGARDRDGAAEFFGELAVEGGGGGLAGLDFAAGEFPEQAEVFVGGALGDENAAGVVFEDGADYGDRRAVGGRDRIGRGWGRG